MSVILKALAEFVLYAVLAAFAQNAVLSRALGVSHLVRLVDDGATGNGAFCLLPMWLDVRTAIRFRSSRRKVGKGAK